MCGRISSRLSGPDVALSKDREKRERQLANLRPATQGEPSRNPSGRPKKALITDQLVKLLKQRDPKTGKPNAELVELLNRIEGPVPQVQEHTGAGGAPLTITFTQAVPPEEPADE